MTVGKKTRVLIIGGGLAGMSAAEALAASAGEALDITLLEAKRITGGRAGSFTDPSSGNSVDYCQHVAMACCTNFIGLMERSGLDRQFQRFSQLTFHHPNYVPSIFSPSKWLPAPLHLAKTIPALKYLNRKQRSQIQRGLWRLMRTPAEAIAHRTASNWLTENAQDVETIHAFWDVILVSALGEQSNKVSMGAARKVLIDGFAAARGASDILVPMVPLSQLFGVRLLEHLRSLGVSVRTRCVVKQAEQNTKGTAVELASGERVTADHVVCAVPWYRISDVLRNTNAANVISNFEQFTRYPTSPITGLHLWFDREITPESHAVMVGTLAQWLFRDPTPSPADRQDFYYQVVISASRDIRNLSKQEVIQTVLKELQHAFPLARKAELVRHRIVTDPKSVFSVQPDVEASRPPARTPLPWLHLAGDWIDTGWPATMEGAVISGRMAASSVLQQMSMPPVEIDQGLPRGWLARCLIKP